MSIDEKSFSNEIVVEQFKDKFGVSDVDCAIPIKASNLAVLKNVVLASGMDSCGCMDDDEELEFNKMVSDFDEVKTIKGFKDWLNKYGICELYYLKIFKNHLVSFFDWEHKIY